MATKVPDQKPASPLVTNTMPKEGRKMGVLRASPICDLCSPWPPEQARGNSCTVTEATYLSYPHTMAILAIIGKKSHIQEIIALLSSS